MAKPLFRLGTAPAFRLLVAVFLGLALIAIDQRYNQLSTARYVVASVLHPLQLAAEAPMRLFRGLGSSWTQQQNLVLENKLLRDELLELRARQLRYEALRDENERLRAMLNASTRHDDRVQIARLIAVDLDPFRHQIALNRGNRDDVYVGQPVLHAEGIIGQVIEVYRNHSIAILISDPGHALPVVNARTELRAILVGTGNPRELILRHIPVQEDLQIGDVLRTSGLDGRFPPDYPVAVVTEVEPATGDPFLRVKAEPLAALDRSREALLLWPEPESLAPPRPRVDNDPENGHDADPSSNAGLRGSTSPHNSLPDENATARGDAPSNPADGAGE